MSNKFEAALYGSVCHEEVSRNDEAQPCDRPAVSYRIDEEGYAYPVCKRHHRPPFVLSETE